ncbi:Probable ribonuclease VapC 1 [Neorhizobium galegae bv. officinalis bv. officinalis str. HAMBI 1141]|uniref:Ribonuclease VapC n=1 Tax=Neorhizobium galegae bv. officinalis bv. officinalis str. HAMBI 1141 TaxID=1028801 RepID=A0A068T7C2_NEOGA|nr:PIN domain-containing protein [Neorhizobium galegae]CDN53260.1 Probable ribonuclease VapC 1 [Neorhizobium galegae bv. officinalis bv. officinalis str. HAMBI 1141]
MILLDTSIWIDHLRKREEAVEFLLKRKQVLVHPFVIGEVALGPMPRYDLVLQSLSELPQALVASDPEVLLLIRQHSLMGSGIGYVDAHLLASTRLHEGTRLLTRDKRLARIATALGIGYEP